MTSRYQPVYPADQHSAAYPKPVPQSKFRTLFAFTSGALVAIMLSWLSAGPPQCPACNCAGGGELAGHVERAVEGKLSSIADAALSKCPKCAQCHECPACPTCPSASCPSCPECPTLSCPELPSTAALLSASSDCPDTTAVVSAYREKMLSKVGANIIECKPGTECRADSKSRYRVLGQKGVTLWMTGLSGSGKTTIAEALEKTLLYKLGKNVYRIDGDNLRTGLTRDLGFSPGDRTESVRRASEVAALFAEAGVISLVTLISPYRKDRDAAREMHKKRGIPFLEVFMDVPLEVVQARDPKGLYKKVAEGKIKNFTGVDAPYEAPLAPEVLLKNSEMSVEKCVEVLRRALADAGLLTGLDAPGVGLLPPDGGEHVNLIVPDAELPAKMAEAATLPTVPLRDVDTNWLQTVAEGWAAPLKGFMREGALLQTLHFNSLLVDTYNATGAGGINEKATDFNKFPFYPPSRVSMPLPIVLPITDFTKRSVGKAKAVALTNSIGQPLAILRNPEIYENRKEEITARMYGTMDPKHPYIDEVINKGGNWLIGGEIECLGKIKYNDGLDQFRLTMQELQSEFQKRNADVVYAFQTRNPTHAGHAFLMVDGGRQLAKDKGYKKPVLWLSPLGGWTKDSDVPLDVRVKQHHEVIQAGQLPSETTVMSIWPSPMVYAGPTEVQFHAKSRRVGGASYFVVGRDPAGLPRMSGPLKGEDLYNADHGRYVLSYSPGIGDMQFLSFGKVYYDKQDHTMKPKDKSRADDFISISGSKMRKLAALGSTPCPTDQPIPSDLVGAKCVPPGFMVQKGWEIMIDYYQNVNTKQWVPYSQQLISPTFAAGTKANDAKFGNLAFSLTFESGGKTISPWHEVPLTSGTDYNFISEIPMGTTAKMEVQKKVQYNPIMHDSKKNKIRYYTYGNTFFNYGLFPQTWEDPSIKGFNGTVGDNDPLDVMEIGSKRIEMGTIKPVKILGDIELIDQGEMDHKIIVIATDDPDAAKINSLADLKTVKPGVLEAVVDWLKNYKTTDGKEVNVFAKPEPSEADYAKGVVSECYNSWKKLVTEKPADTGFWFP